MYYLPQFSVAINNLAAHDRVEERIPRMLAGFAGKCVLSSDPTVNFE